MGKSQYMRQNKAGDMTSHAAAINLELLSQYRRKLMLIKKADYNVIPLLAENRLEFATSIRTIQNSTEFLEHTRTYLLEHIDDGSIISYIAVEDEKIVSSCILCIYETLPTPSCLNGKSGLLLNVYTLAGYRRQGLAYNLLIRLIADARQAGVGKILLDYTQDGYPLYRNLGFDELEHEMVLKLQ